MCVCVCVRVCVCVVMFALTVVVAGGQGSTAEDIVNYYLPVIMAEMDAPVSTRGEYAHLEEG